MFKCKKCHEFRFDTDCHCKKFVIANEDGEERNIFAIDEEAAAISYAKIYNENGDYALMHGSIEIKVNGKKYSISAEPDIYYSAHAL